jgi:hypothetical protein
VREHVAGPFHLHADPGFAELLLPPLLEARPAEAGNEPLLRQVSAPAEETQHEIGHAVVAGVLVMLNEGVQHHHVRPQVGQYLPPAARDRLMERGSKIAVRLAAGQHCVDPAQGLVGDAGILGQHAERIEATQPVRLLFPARVGAAEPTVAGCEEVAQLREPADHAVGHEL